VHRWSVDPTGSPACPKPRPERWIVVTVEEAYIHRSWYIPKLEPVRRTRD
jgi:hypothetical protein